MTKYKVDGEEFESRGDAMNFCAEFDIPLDHIEEIEEATIEENPPENPNEDVEVISEKELEERLAVSKALEEYNEYDELGKAEIIQQALAKTEDKTVGERRLKVLAKKRTTKSIIKDEYEKILDKLSDEDMISCPACNRSWEFIEKEMKEELKKEELSFREQWKNLETEIPMIRLFHFKTSHPAIFSLIRKLWEVPESERRYDDIRRDDSESCSEELSKEELTQEIASNPELRKELFRRWLKELENRK